MISDFDEAHLQSLVSSLGKKQRFPEQSGLQYVKDPQSRGRSLFSFFFYTSQLCTPETLQDLLRFLRRDSTRERPIMMLLHAWDVAGNDILPMVQAYHSGAPDLILDAGEHALRMFSKPLSFSALKTFHVSAVKLLVFLTLPADPGALNFNAQRHHINRTVEALTRNSCAVVFSHLAEPLERFESSRLRSRDEDGKTIQLFLTFIRNLLLSYHDNSPYNAASSSHNVDSKVF